MQFQTTKNKEEGFASITIAIVLIIVLALTTIGFAQLARREQQSALSKQLAAQANYAAESGINDVANYIQNNPDNLAVFNKPDECLTVPGNGVLSSIDGNVDGQRSVVYSCVIVDPTPPTLDADIDAFGSWGTTFGTTSNVSSLDITWKNKNGESRSAKSAAEKGQFKPVGLGNNQWGSAPAVLQVSITKLDSLSRDTLINEAFTAYLYPSAGATNSVAYGSQKGQIINGNCTSGTNSSCTSSITNLSGNGPFLIRIVSYYDDSSVVVSAGAGNKFTGSQAKVDVTGKARNVLKRLKVSIPLGESYDLPSNAIEAKNVCKRQVATPASVTFRDSENPDAAATANTGNPCYLSN